MRRVAWVTRGSATLVLVATSAVLAGCASPLPPIKPAAHVDLDRYMGRWYVIAAILPGSEKGEYNPVETYVLEPDDRVCTWFRMRKNSFHAPVELTHTVASVVPGTGNAQWRVHLYWVLRLQYLVGWLKPDYSQVMVVRDARDYLWYMARTPMVSKSDYQAMLQRAQAMGYDSKKIVKAPQRWPELGTGSHTLRGECP